MKKFLLIGFLVISLGCSVGYLLINNDKPSVANSLVYRTSTAAPITFTPQATNTPYPTITPAPTIDYRATDMAYQLQMEHERNEMIKVQLAHDEEMMKQQIELARIGATQTFAPTAIALVNAENTLSAGQLTAISVQATGTAQVPTQMAAIFRAQDEAKHATENRVKGNIAWTLGMVAIVALTVMTIRIPKLLQSQKENQDDRPQDLPGGLTPYIREERGQGDFGQWYVPCTPEQMTEIWELVVNGERNFAINRIETTSRTLRRPTLIKLRKWFRQNNFATELGAGEIALNDRAVAFIEKWGEDHELEEGYEFVPPPPNEND
jgi:hypothetical protein